MAAAVVMAATPGMIMGAEPRSKDLAEKHNEMAADKTAGGGLGVFLLQPE